MKILLVNNNHYRAGGAESVYLNTINLLREKNHQVLSLSRLNSKTIVTGNGEFFINYSDNIYDRFYNQAAAKKIEYILKTEKPEIVHIHRVIGGITFSILPVIKKYNIPVVMTIHDFRMLCPVTMFMNRKGEICEKCLGGNYFQCVTNNCSPEGRVRSSLIATESYLRDFFLPYDKYVDKFIFVSDFSKKKFLEVKPELEEKSFRIYNFSKRFHSYNFFGNYFLYVGRLVREKGLFTLLNAFKDLPQINLKILGDGELRNMIVDAKSSNVELLGYKHGEELEELIGNASFAIVPSECYENNPMSIVESYSFGKPVIGAELGGIPEVIVNGKTGFLFKARESENLASIVSRCSKISISDYQELSQNAFLFAQNNFTQEIYYDSLIKIYNMLIS